MISLSVNLSFRKEFLAQKRNDNKCVRECRENQMCTHYCYKLVEQLLEIVWRVTKNLKIELPNDLEIPKLGIQGK